MDEGGAAERRGGSIPPGWTRYLDHLPRVWGRDAAGACALSLPGLWVARLLLRRAVLRLLSAPGEGVHDSGDQVDAGAETGGDAGELVGARARSASPRASRSRSRSGSQRRAAQHWNSAPSRVRRWLRPTTLRPPTVTSPGPSPAKHTHGDHGVRCIAPSCQRARRPGADQHLRPGGAQPVEGPADVVVPPPVTGRDRDVDPQRRPWLHQHRRSAAAAVHDIDAPVPDPFPVDGVVLLRRAEHQRRAGDVVHDDAPLPHRPGRQPLPDAVPQRLRPASPPPPPPSGPAARRRGWRRASSARSTRRRSLPVSL